MTLRNAIGAIIGLAVLWGACNERDKHGKIVDSPTAGTIVIAVDESLRPVMEAEASAFEAIYKEAHLQVIYTSEAGAIDVVLKDSARLAVVSRRLTIEETSVLASEQLVPLETHIATGAVALIVNSHNSDSLIRISQLRDVLEGKIKDWNQINALSKSAPIEVIFDNPASGIARFLKDSIANGKALPSNCFAVSSNRAVVEYVSQKPNAIGLIGVEWISDRDDGTANKFLETIRVVSLAGDSSYVKPYQAYIALKEYPLRRDIVIVSREARAGLGSGFTAFVAGDKGQRIVLKAGLVSVTMPIRIVEINRDEK